MQNNSSNDAASFASLPSTRPHPVFQNLTVYEVNRARHDIVSCSDLNYEDVQERLKLEVYFHVKELLDARVNEEDGLSRIFQLMDIYAGKRVKK